MQKIQRIALDFLFVGGIMSMTVEMLQRVSATCVVFELWLFNSCVSRYTGLLHPGNGELIR